MQHSTASTRQRFGLRKLTVGVASVLLGTTFYAGMSLVAHAATSPVQMESATDNHNVASDSKAHQDDKVSKEDLGNGFVKETTTTQSKQDQKTILPHATHRIKDTTVEAGKEVVKQAGMDGQQITTTIKTTKKQVVKGNIEFLTYNKGDNLPDDPYYQMIVNAKVGEHHENGELNHRYREMKFVRDSFVDPKTGETVFTKWREISYKIVDSPKAGSSEKLTDGKTVKKSLDDVIKEFEHQVTIDGMTFKDKIAVDATQDLNSQLEKALPKNGKVVKVNGNIANIEIALPTIQKQKQNQSTINPVDEIIAYNDELKPVDTHPAQPKPDSQPEKPIDKLSNLPHYPSDDSDKTPTDQTQATNKQNTLPQTGNEQSELGTLGLLTAGFAGLFGLRKKNY